MIHHQKRIFLYALILTFFVFNLGIFMGYMLESSRIDRINNLYLETETELLDQMAQKDAIEMLNLDCDTLVEENIKFGDKIFEEAILIQRYEDANKISNDIIFQHKRFDLLRALFWMNSIKIKQKCNPNYHNIVYFYDYINPSMEQISMQRFLSNFLQELKEEKGEEIMLIPIAADNDIPSINLLIRKYNVNNLPAILVDEEILIMEIESKEDFEKYLD
jgi:hypothetical protein